MKSKKYFLKKEQQAEATAILEKLEAKSLFNIKGGTNKPYLKYTSYTSTTIP